MSMAWLWPIGGEACLQRVLSGGRCALGAGVTGSGTGATLDSMAVRTAVAPRFLRAAQPLPAASRLKPTLLLSLQAFDAAVRLGSFKEAAEALHLTPSAISHRIRNLERAMGGALFVRAHRAVEVTPTGRTLARATGRAFGELVRATSPLVGVEASRRLRLSVSPLFASAWLLPRIADFMARHPDIELVIENSVGPLDLENEPFDAAVRAGDGTWPGLVGKHLLDLHAVPVATRELVRRLKLRRPADMVRAPMIHVVSFPYAWPQWLRRAGAGASKAKQAVWVDSFEAALQLAERGAGVALGLTPLFADREAAGTLCRPVALTNPTGAYWLLHRPEESHNAALRGFKRWLIAGLAANS
ncbi:LysR substrate-binding domain-containing protein [Reyranella massiliensis]|uniref:LysR substrate-binding domain-containing protein n=1 Tax=Reyranella massiliensis TaxID=445220 RepID=UPI001FE0B795|nr:LysR substrate-binding domain-containing protein [Reyranella massiliensis]